MANTGKSANQQKISTTAAGIRSVGANAGVGDSNLTGDVQPLVLDTTMRVTTPENISFEYQLAGPFRRIIAYLLDFMVSICGYFAVVLILWLLVLFAITPLAQMMGISSFFQGFLGLLSGMMFVGFFVIYWFYGALMETYYNGQTLGKRWTQMRVLSADGHSIDGVQATLRNFFRLFDISPMISLSSLGFPDEMAAVRIPTCLFGLIMMTLSRRFQRVGDLVANTVVVNEATIREPGLIVFTDERVVGLAALIPNNFLPPRSLIKAIAEYADQRRVLPPQRASEIAAHVAQPLIERLGLMPDTDYDLFLCALYYKIFVAAQPSESPFAEIAVETASANEGQR